MDKKQKELVLAARIYFGIAVACGIAAGIFFESVGGGIGSFIFMEVCFSGCLDDIAKDA